MNAERTPSLLIVDDTETNIDVLVEILEDDYEICVAMDGPTAIELAIESNPDLILLDIMMPGMSGYEVCERLKADSMTSHIPILFISAMAETDNETRGLELGAVDYIRKPVCAPIVRARVKNHIQLAQYREHLEDLVIQRTAELLEAQDATIESMAALAEFRDQETGAHIKRTRNYVRCLAEELRLSPKYRNVLHSEVIDSLYKSAPLHDIGKIGIPDSILLKPGKLTKDEFDVMKLHTEYGFNAIKTAENNVGNKLSFLAYAKEIAYTHHEKWDGSGYPRGLSGEEIPISGRLMALADVYDALICKRCYKDAFAHEKAVEIIKEGSGTHFDPDIVEAFLNVQLDFQRIAIAFRDESAHPDQAAQKITTPPPSLSLFPHTS
jgi:putative two-component system response regulator